MNNLKTSTKVLIILVASAIVLAAVLFFTMPEPWAEKMSQHTAMIAEGDFDKLYDNEGFHRLERGYPYHKPHSHFGGILIVFLFILLVFKFRTFHGRRNHSGAILDELYAEEKITEEEYKRRRTVIEEETKK